MLRLPNVIVGLDAQPYSRFSNPGTLQADRQIGADGSMTMHDAGQSFPSKPEATRKFSDTDSQGRDYVFQQGFAWVRRVMHRHDALHQW